MTETITRAPTNLKRGFKRIFILLSIGWLGFWAINIAETYFSEQHRKLQIYASKDKVTLSYLTLGNSGSSSIMSATNASEVGSIDGKRFIFFFHADSAETEKFVLDWVKSLSRQSMDDANEIASNSRNRASIERLLIALGVPAAMATAWLLGYFVYRGFRPKPQNSRLA